MAGLFGIHDPSHRIDLAAAQQRAQAFTIPGAKRLRIETDLGNGLLLGRCHLGIHPLPHLPARLPDDRPTVACAGYALTDQLQQPGWDNTTLARLITDNNPQPVVSQLNGRFQIAVWRPATRTLQLANDRCGLMPLYLYEHDDTFYFAGEPQILHALIGGVPALDPEAVADWMEIEYLADNRTLLKGVTVLPPATVRTATPAGTSSNTYWQLAFNTEPRPFDFEDTADHLHRALTDSVSARLQTDARIGVSLSGGMDSRLLTGYTVQARPDIGTFTFGFAHGDEHRIAEQVAAELGCPHLSLIEESERYWKSLPIDIARSAGMHIIADMSGLASLPAVADRFDAIVNGLGGNELFGFLSGDLMRLAALRSQDQFTTWLYRKLTAGWPPPDLGTIRAAIAPDSPSTEDRLAETLRSQHGRPFLDQFYWFYTVEKSRRVNLFGVTMDSHRVEPILPFMDNRVLDPLLSLPADQRQLARFYRRFFARQFPSLARIPYDRTGLPITAGDTRILARKLRDRLAPRSRQSPPLVAMLGDRLRERITSLLTDTNARLPTLLEAELIQRTASTFWDNTGANPRPLTQLITLELFLRHLRDTASSKADS